MDHDASTRSSGCQLPPAQDGKAIQKKRKPTAEAARPMAADQVTGPAAVCVVPCVGYRVTLA